MGGGRRHQLKNGSRAAITTCVTAAKGALLPGDEFVFFFSGHGGDSRFPDAAEAGEGPVGSPSDNHIRIGNNATGADRMTDDQLATLLSGFKKSVTINVVLDSCFSHTFMDGANDLPSITQANGLPAPVGDHLGFLASSSPTNPKCSGGFTDKLADALKIVDGVMKGDTNKDGTLTSKEAGDFTRAYQGNNLPKCDQISPSSCPSGDLNQETRTISPDCGPFDSVCPRLAQVPEPNTFLLSVTGAAALAGVAWGRRRPSSDRCHHETRKRTEARGRRDPTARRVALTADVVSRSAWAAGRVPRRTAILGEDITRASGCRRGLLLHEPAVRRPARRPSGRP